ncbi:hypothetical protein [Tepidiphilus baoligensis]|uniref:hypothetical protein n=1 Tax=Tepidiphilus baoligensis TaxID=2698687 RepID=UPI0036DE2F06
MIVDDGLEILWRNAGWVDLIDELRPGRIGPELAEGGDDDMMRMRQSGEAAVQQRMDGGAVKLSTFIPLQIRKRGVRKVVIRPDGGECQSDCTGPARQHYAGYIRAGLLLATVTRRRVGGQR